MHVRSIPSNKDCPAAIPFELKIGVTGHRTLSDETGIRRAVGQLLDYIQSVLESSSAHPYGTEAGGGNLNKRIDHVLLSTLRTFWKSIPPSPTTVEPHMRTPVHWCVVSGMAQGADAIVADAVLAQPNARLQAILPFAAEEYLANFTTSEHRDTFERLLACDPTPLVLDGQKYDAVGRSQSYRNAGEQVVRRCDILIAIWDGEPARGLGGTGDIVQFAQNEGRMTLWIDAKHPGAPVKRLVPGSEANPGTGKDWGTVELPTTAKGLCLGYHQLSAYNRDMAASAADIADSIEAHWTNMSLAANDARLSDAVLGERARLLLSHYCRADLLAQRYQNLHFRSAKGLFKLAAAGGTVSVLQTMFLPAWYGLVGLEVAAMLAILIVIRISRRECWHEKWLHDRHFAERLRARVYLNLLGDDSEVGESTFTPGLVFYHRPADWVDIAFNNLELPPTTPPVEEAQWKAVRDFIHAHWVDAQARWHDGNAVKKGRRPKRVHWIGAGVFTATLLAALLHAFGVGHGAHGSEVHDLSMITKLLVCTTILLPVWGATLHAIDTLLDWHRISIRSELMGRLLYEVADDLRRAQTPEEIRAQVRIAYEIMAAENHEWAASLAFRGPVLPT